MTQLKKNIMHYRSLSLDYIPMFKRIYLFEDGKRLGEYKNEEFAKAKKAFHRKKKELMNNGK